jgi:DNA helicase-2/ATP-dependent DNA helicase PcrA
MMGQLYKLYCARCFQANAMDFDDLLFQTNILFRDHLDVLHKYQHKFKHVMVDEFQDTNVSQYLITKKLSAVHRNICVVGDDAQSIYAFRGADIQNILNFERDYSDLTTIKLEENYRSTKAIVAVANSVISRNKNQLKKDVFTSNEDGEQIEIIRAGSDNEEGRIIASTIFETCQKQGLRFSDFAILYRTNAQSRSFEESLRRLNIKYRIIGGLSFYQRKEIKDVLGYLRFVVNQQDEEAFKRIINLPKRGIGDTTIAKISVTAAEQNSTVWEVVSNINQFQGVRGTAPIEQFADLIKSYKLMVEVEQKDAYEVASHVAKTSGLVRELYEDKTVEGLARYQNVQELLNAIKQFVDSEENEDKSLSTFLQSVSLLTNADTTEDPNDKDKVTLMTVHSAKGLEFKHVFLVGMEEDLFPSQMMLQRYRSTHCVAIVPKLHHGLFDLSKATSNRNIRVLTLRVRPNASPGLALRIETLQPKRSEVRFIYLGCRENGRTCVHHLFLDNFRLLSPSLDHLGIDLRSVASWEQKAINEDLVLE